MGTSACGTGGEVSLTGTYTLEAALVRLTAGAPCTWRVVEARSVLISAAAPAAPVVREAVRPTTLVGEVLVTATKRPMLVGNLAAGVSVIPHGQIDLTGAADASQTTGQLAGVLTTNLGPGRDKLLIRGLSDGAFTGRARSTVSTYLDDSPINYNAPDPALRLVDIDRVEVLRGPQGALYGSGAVSGIYRIVTRKPELNRLGGGAAALYAVTDGGDPSREIEGYLNVPLGGRAALRAVAYHDVQGGYLDDVNLGIENVDRSQRDGARLALRLELAESWRLDLTATGQKLRSSDTQYTTAAIRDQRSNRVREAHKNDFGQGGLTLTGELGWASLTSSLAYVRHTYASHYDASAVLEPVFLSDPAGVALYIERTKVDMWVQDLVLRSTRPGRLTWLAGIYAAATDEGTPAAFDIRNAVGRLTNVYGEARRNRLREIAVYGEGSWEFAPGWRGSIGGRLFESRVRTTSEIVAAPPGASRSMDAGRRFNGLSPKLTLQREFESGDLVYALFSEGYRPGGFNSSGFLPIRTTRRSFEPDRLRNFELGAKLRLLDRRLGVRTALYYDEWSNIQTDQYRPSGLSYTANVGDAQIFGLEAEVGYDFDFGLSLQANALLASSELTRVNPDFAIRSSSEPPIRILAELPGVPQRSGGLLALYERSLPRGLTLRLAGEAAYVGGSAVSFDAGVLGATDSYVRAKLSAEVATDVWSLGLFIANPANDAGDTFAYGNPFSLHDPTARQVTPQRPRTIGLRLAAAF